MKNSQKSAALSREFENFLSEMENMLHDAATLGGDELAEASARIQERMAKAKEAAASVSSDLGRRARKAAARANLEAHEEPWKIAGAGAVLGLLLGLALARR